MTSPVRIAFRDVSVRFGALTVVENVSYEVRDREFVSIIGPSGCGKTTMMNIVAGFVQPTVGQVLLDGQPVAGPGPERGVIFQEYGVFPWLTVEQNIRAVLESVEPDPKKRERELDALLDEFSITRLRHSPSIALSGGERRRCEIARALAGRPHFMLLDEPFAGIDPIAVGDIQDLVKHLKSRGIGVSRCAITAHERVALKARSSGLFATTFND
jgi:lipopolysaccharide export system ATP-binding protein